jgi:hypothetical protein
MCNERSCCFGKDYEMAFHFPSPALGHSYAKRLLSIHPWLDMWHEEMLR